MIATRVKAGGRATDDRRSALARWNPRTGIVALCTVVSCTGQLILDTGDEVPPGAGGADGSLDTRLETGSEHSAGSAGNGGAAGRADAGSCAIDGACRDVDAEADAAVSDACDDAMCDATSPSPDAPNSDACTSDACHDAPTDMRLPHCGNGRIEEELGEECEDGNRTLGDGCDDCRFSCVPDDPERGCGDLCAGSPECDGATHRCRPTAPLPDRIACAPGRACKDGSCQPFEPPTGGLVRFEFTATVEVVYELVPDEVKPGDAIIGYFSFDPVRLDERGTPTAATYVYSNIPHDFEMYVSAGRVHLASYNSGRGRRSDITIGNDQVLSAEVMRDEYYVDCSEVRVAGSSGLQGHAGIELHASVRLDAISSLALPIVPPRLELFDTRRIQIVLGGGNIIVYGTITSLTAAP